MKKMSPIVIHACIQELGIPPKDFVALLLTAKKLYIRHGMQMTKKEYIQIISGDNIHLAGVLGLLHELHCKNAEDVAALIRNISHHEDLFLCSVDASEAIDVHSIENIIENTVHENNVFMTKKLHVPGVHITSDTHRYGRTIQDDMDKMLNG